jgi:hypothetical protein
LLTLLSNLSTRGSAFHDITIGNNESSRQSGAYTAQSGWDACTGLGSPDGTNLINALQSLKTASGDIFMSDHAPVEKHPIFGHTLSNERLPFHDNALSLHGPLVHLKGTIKKVEPDVKFHGTSHYHLIINQIELISIKGADPSLGNPGDPVLHFTHHPVGFVIYKGKRYE